MLVAITDKNSADFVVVPRFTTHVLDHYTPGIYAEGYIVFVFPFVCSFVRTSFCHVEFASKFCVKVSQVVHISATTYSDFIWGFEKLPFPSHLGKCFIKT